MLDVFKAYRAPVHASSDTSRCLPQDSERRWSRCLLSCRTLSFPTTCRFNPALARLTLSETDNPKTYFARPAAAYPLCLAGYGLTMANQTLRNCEEVFGSVS